MSVDRGLESLRGIMAKSKQASCVPGNRHKEFFKTKGLKPGFCVSLQTEEAVIHFYSLMLTAGKHFC